MRARLGRVTIAATVIGALLVPAVGSGADPKGPKHKLERNEKRLEAVRRQIAADAGRASTLKEKVDSLNASMAKLQVEANALTAEIARVEESVAAAQARINETQDQIDKVEHIATKQAVELYKEGGTETITALLDSESLAELDEKAELMGVAARENTGALTRYSRLQVTIQEQHREMFDLRAELQNRLEARSALMAEQERQRDQLAGHVAKLRKRLGINQSKESHLESEAAEIQGLVVEAQAKASVASLGTSSSGFIWPLNGAITSPYGPRWGRMHTGIDIDGYTGQPLIAAKEGRVILASYYSGYGNAVIIDHGGGYSTLYGHMSSFSTSNGTYVDQGEVIGYVGCTGNCYGDHVHFEVQINGGAVNPTSYLP